MSYFERKKYYPERNLLPISTSRLHVEKFNIPKHDTKDTTKPNTRGKKKDATKADKNTGKKTGGGKGKGKSAGAATKNASPKKVKETRSGLVQTKLQMKKVSGTTKRKMATDVTSHSTSIKRRKPNQLSQPVKEENETNSDVEEDDPEHDEKKLDGASTKKIKTENPDEEPQEQKSGQHNNVEEEDDHDDEEEWEDETKEEKYITDTDVYEDYYKVTETVSITDTSEQVRIFIQEKDRRQEAVSQKVLHFRNDIYFQCIKCPVNNRNEPRTFANMRDARRHLVERHLCYNAFSCILCPKKCNSKSSMLKHIHRIHFP